MCGDWAFPIDFSYAAQGFAQDFFFVAELGFVGDVLIVAAAAYLEMRARLPWMVPRVRVSQ